MHSNQNVRVHKQSKYFSASPTKRFATASDLNCETLASRHPISLFGQSTEGVGFPFHSSLVPQSTKLRKVAICLGPARPLASVVLSFSCACVAGQGQALGRVLLLVARTTVTASLAIGAFWVGAAKRIPRTAPPAKPISATPLHLQCVRLSQ